MGNFYGTFLVRCKPGNLNFYQHLASLVAYEAIQETLESQDVPVTEELRLKWINDIFWREEKISGVLVRSESIGSQFYAQLGIGVNLNESPFELSTSIRKICALHHKIELEEYPILDLDLFTSIMVEKLIKYLKIIESDSCQELKESYK